MRNFLILIIALTYSAIPLAEAGPTLPSEHALHVSTEEGFADTVEPLMPAVVNIYTVKYNKRSQKHFKNPFSGGFPFDQFNDFFEQFDLPFNFEEGYSDPKAVALGSGFIIEANGYIVTNHHVVANSDEIHVKLLDNSELPAKLIGSDSKTDLALLKIEAKSPLPFVKFGDSNKARVGNWVIAIGNPFGLGGTVTSGIISSKGRDLSTNPNDIIDDFIQTDAAINNGNSGGPMFNIKGEVIGVNTAIFSPSGTNVGIGFAIPSNTVQKIISQLKETGKISRGRLDVTIQEITPEIAEGLGMKEPEGALVIDVLAGGAADKAGVKSGDVIIEFDSQPVKNSRKLQVLVAEAPLNKEISLKVLREGKVIELKTKILEAPIKTEKKHSPKERLEGGSTIKRSGITFSELNSELRQKLNLADEVNAIVITSLDKDKKTYGLRIGDLVIAVNQQYVTTIDQLDKIYQKAKSDGKKNVILLVQRRSVNIFIALPIVE